MSPPESAVDQLLALAKERFGDDFDSGGETDVDTKFFIAAANGIAADYRDPDGDKTKNDPASAKNWGRERVLKADRIEWLCTDREASTLVSRKGIQVVGARIDGLADLNKVRFDHTLSFGYCAFEKRRDFSHASFKALHLDASLCPGLYAPGLRLDGDLHLRHGFIANGEVNLRGATIAGYLECTAGSFLNKGGKAIDANGITVTRALFLRDGFNAEGEVDLIGAFINGSLDCFGGSFVNENRIALNASAMTVNGNIFLQDKFRSLGEVNLAGVSIHGQLSCNGGSFHNENGVALNAVSLIVNGDVLLSKEFEAEGEVNLRGASIDGQLSCNGGTFINRGRTALDADAITVTGSVLLRDTFRAEGMVDLRGASIGGQLDCSDGSFLNLDGTAINADSITVAADVFLRTIDAEGEAAREVYFEAEGSLIFVRANIRGSLQYLDLFNREKATLDLRAAKVGILWDDPKSWPEAGGIQLRGFEYEALDDEATVDAELRIEWLSRDAGKDFSPQPYEQLAKVLSRSGHRREARAIRVEKERLLAKQESARRLEKLKTSPLRVRWWKRTLYLGRWCLDFLYSNLTDYGYRSWKVVPWSLAIILLGWLVYEVGYAQEVIMPTRVESRLEPYEGSGTVYPTFQGLAYSVDAFVPLVNIEQVDYWLPNAARGQHHDLPFGYYWSWSGWLLFFYYFQVASGWVLTTLLVVGLTGMVQRED